MELILYAGGAAGDLVAATIDPTDYKLEGHYLQAITVERIKLRNKIHKTMTDEDRDEYIAKSPYHSLASHRYEYHIDRKHNFILVDSSDPEYAKWATDRFNQIWDGIVPWKMVYQHHPESFQLAKPYTDRIITLKDILEGRMIDRLETMTDKKLHVELYKKWLPLNKF